MLDPGAYGVAVVWASTVTPTQDQQDLAFAAIWTAPPAFITEANRIGSLVVIRDPADNNIIPYASTTMPGAGVTFPASRQSHFRRTELLNLNPAGTAIQDGRSLGCAVSLHELIHILDQAQFRTYFDRLLYQHPTITEAFDAYVAWGSRDAYYSYAASAAQEFVPEVMSAWFQSVCAPDVRFPAAELGGQNAGVQLGNNARLMASTRWLNYMSGSTTRAANVAAVFREALGMAPGATWTLPGARDTRIRQLFGAGADLPQQ
jgi:hypothetical protein